MWGQHPNHADKIIYNEWGVFLDGTGNNPNTADFQCSVPAPVEPTAINGPLINVTNIKVIDRHETLNVTCTLTIIKANGTVTHTATLSTSGTPGLTTLAFTLPQSKYGIAHYRCSVPEKSALNPGGWSGIGSAFANYLE
jgi:hypothetical protein